CRGTPYDLPFSRNRWRFADELAHQPAKTRPLEPVGKNEVVPAIGDRRQREHLSLRRSRHRPALVLRAQTSPGLWFADCGCMRIAMREAIRWRRERQPSDRGGLGAMSPLLYEGERE